MQRLLCLLVSLAVASNVTPVEKVVQMLESMKQKGTKAMREEQVQYATFKQFCEQTSAEKGKSIAEAGDQIESLEAEIEQATTEATRLGAEAAQHLAEASAAEDEKSKATALRTKSREDFTTTLKDYTESIDALGRALKVLKEEKKSSSLLELRSVRELKRLPAAAAQHLDAFTSFLEGPDPKTYEFQSGGVISMLEGLQDKFVDERINLEKEEQNKKHSYDMLVQSLNAQTAQAKKDQQEKSQFQTKRLQAKAAAAGDLEETKTQKASDEKYAADLKATCSKKASAYADRQKLREEELEALEKAQEVIAGEAVSGNAKKHLRKSLLSSSSSSVSLAFLRSETAPMEQVARFLQQRAQQLNSRVLSATAARVGADPIAKVKAMIEGLVEKMQAQANEDATKQGWCDAELASNKAIREEKSNAADELKAEMDELSSAISKLGEEVLTLNKEIASLDSAMANATAMRQKEKAKNAETVSDAKEAQKAVAQALSVLKEFYAKAGKATSLVQKPKIFDDEPYQGLSGESGGVISMMEVIASDFARLQADTEAGEKSATTEFEEFMEDSKVDKAAKSKTVEHKSNKKQSKSQELMTLQGDFEGTTKELDAAKAYLEKLKPDCVDAGASYAKRKAQREEELKDLQTALEMLQNL